MISVLLVDDSDSERDRLAEVLAADPAIRVVATAADGRTAAAEAAVHDPDVIVMDWEMPTMDGLAATRSIMEAHPRPVVLCSDTWRPDDFDGMTRIHEAGAVAAVRKPGDPSAAAFDDRCRELVRAVHRSAGVKVVRRWRRDDESNGRTRARAEAPAQQSIRVVAIGVSTGGPPVLEAILSRLPASFPVPILIVQHIADGFVHGLVDWLKRVTRLQVELAANGECAYGGHVYLAPDGRHLGIDAGGRLVLDDSPPERSQRPAVSYLFRSVGAAFAGQSAGVLLTGMGSDGAAELKHLRALQAVTIAQNERTCTVFGMPGEAIKIGAAKYVLPPDEIGDLLCRICGLRGLTAAERPDTAGRVDFEREMRRTKTNERA